MATLRYKESITGSPTVLKKNTKQTKIPHEPNK